MSEKIEYVLELTEEEALAVVRALGPTTGDVCYRVYLALVDAYGDAFEAHEAALRRFPDPQRLQ